MQGRPRRRHGIEAGCRRMARDKVREAEVEWSEALIGDVAAERRHSFQSGTLRSNVSVLSSLSSSDSTTVTKSGTGFPR